MKKVKMKKIQKFRLLWIGSRLRQSFSGKYGPFCIEKKRAKRLHPKGEGKSSRE